MFTVKALTPIMSVDIDGSNWFKQGLVVEDSKGNIEAGSVYASSEDYFVFNLTDTITIDEIKFNKGGSVSFKGVTKVNLVEDEVEPLF